MSQQIQEGFATLASSNPGRDLGLPAPPPPTAAPTAAPRDASELERIKTSHQSMKETVNNVLYLLDQQAESNRLVENFSFKIQGWEATAHWWNEKRWAWTESGTGGKWVQDKDAKPPSKFRSKHEKRQRDPNPPDKKKKLKKALVSAFEAVQKLRDAEFGTSSSDDE